MNRIAIAISFALLLGLGALVAPAALAAEESDPIAEEAPAGNDARVAMIATTLFPGLGQLYNEEGLRTLVVFVWESYYIATILREGLEADFYKRRAASLAPGETWNGQDYSQLRSLFHFHEDKQTDYIWYSAALFLGSLLDAYVFAHLYSFETDDIRSRRSLIMPVFRNDSFGLTFRLRF